MKIKVGDLVYDESLAYRNNYEIFVIVGVEEPRSFLTIKPRNKYNLYSLRRKKFYTSHCVVKIEEHERQLRELEKINEK